MAIAGAAITGISYGAQVSGCLWNSDTVTYLVRLAIGVCYSV